jgi:hypothetical protein
MTSSRTSGPAKRRSTAHKPATRIVFTGDFLRLSDGGLRPTQHENIQWLYQLLQVPLSMATGLPTSIVHWDNNWVNQSCVDRGTVEAIYRMFGETPNIRAWPKVFAAQELPASVENMFVTLFAESFVIGFELPPYLVTFFERHGIGFVDCSLSPVRFMDDILFDVSSNVAAITKLLPKHAVKEDLIRLQAGIVSSNIAKMNPRPPRPNTLLLILQTVYDKVVIENGKFTTVLDYLDTLTAVAEGYDHILIKEHPLEKQPDTRDYLLATLRNAEVTTYNFYRLVAHPNLKGVAALSSSCVLEAGYFGKSGHYLLPGFTPETFTVGAKGYHVDDIVICPDFWRDILASSPCPTTSKDGIRLQSKPNRFRQQLRSAWSYNQIDTDIPASWAKA